MESPVHFSKILSGKKKTKQKNADLNKFQDKLS